MKRAATAVLLLGIAAFQSPLVGQDKISQSRFASLWTREAPFSEPELLALSKDPEPVARQFAALRLAELDPPSDAVLDALVQALGDPAEEVRLQALAGLMRLGRPATRVLADALSDLEPVAVAALVDSQLETWPVSRSDLAFAALVYSRDVDVDVLLRAYASAPPEVIEEDTETRNEFIDEESMDEEDVGQDRSTPASPRERIRLVLEQISPQPTPCLYRALRTEDVALRALVASMIGRAGAEDAAPSLARARAKWSLRRLLRHEDPQRRSLAIRVYPDNADDSAKLVAALLQDPEREVQRAALDRIYNPEQVEWWSGDPCEMFRESPPALLVDLPDAALSRVTALARDADTPTRVAAVSALSAFGCARPEHAAAVADSLLALVSDPDDEIASEAADRLVKMADLRILPASAHALDRVLEALIDPGRGRSYRDLLAVLQHMELPEARQKETVDTLVTACLRHSFSCSSVEKLLRERPAWLSAAVDSLVTRYPDVQSYDTPAFDALEELGPKSPIYPREMERLLNHSESSFRLRAAIALAKRGISTPRVWQVLEEGARSAEDRGWRGGKGSAARALAGLGEQGIERLITIINSTPPATHVELKRVLAHFARYSSKAADVILATASDSSDPAQPEAVQALSSLKSRAAEVRVALEKAFSTRNAEVRRAVVDEWSQVDQPAPSDLIELAFADPALRSRTLQLVERLPNNDLRRLTLTAAALQDEDVWGEWLQFAGELGEPGEALLVQYASRGKPLIYDFFEGVQRLGSIGGALAAALEARAPNEHPAVQERIFELLAKKEKEAPLNRDLLYAQLRGSRPAEREYAANALWSLQEDPWAWGGLLADVLAEAEVRNIVKLRLVDALFMLEPWLLAQGDSPNPGFYKDWPRFTWPPPPGYKPTLVPRKLFTTPGRTTLGDIYRKLDDAIEAAGDGFELGLFLGPADGFTLVARMERVTRDGTPFPEPARWMQEGSPKLSLVELLADLFFDEPGYFRVIVFAVTDDLAPGYSPGARLPEPEEGAVGIPSELAQIPFDGKDVLALVYSFQRRRDAKIIPWKDGAPSAKQHLERAGVWKTLEAAAYRR